MFASTPANADCALRTKSSMLPFYQQGGQNQNPLVDVLNPCNFVQFLVFCVIIRHDVCRNKSKVNLTPRMRLRIVRSLVAGERFRQRRWTALPYDTLHSKV